MIFVCIMEKIFHRKLFIRKFFPEKSNKSQNVGLGADKNGFFVYTIKNIEFIDNYI